MSEVLQHATKSPCEQIEAIECGVQGDVSFLTKGLRNWDESPRERIEAIEHRVQGDRAGLGNGEACTHEQMSEVLQHATESPRERIEAIERGIQGDVRCCHQCDCPKATQDVEDSGNSEDSQRMDGFVGRCLGEIKSVVEIVGGQMYKKVLFAEQKSEVLQHAAKSLRKRNKAIEKPERIEATEKVRAGPLGAGKWRGRGGHAQANLATCCVSGSKRPKKSGRKMVRRRRARTSKCRKSCNMPRERIEVIEKVRAGQPGQENGQGRARTSNRSKGRKSCNMLPKPA
ncbi:hypothetical protein EDB84DRAFT_1447293 [Lactarius hengduanensis]|nr:hypothetical protein EDB84DRAFT_1447293 [Lactarius hengduanensis]